MTQGFQRFTKRYVNVLGVLIGLAVVSSILLYSGCGMTSSPNIPANPTPTPTPTPDTTRPTSTITSPTAGATVLIGKPVAITGTASDAGGGSVVRVEVSVDGGATFSAAAGTNAWSFNWTPSALGPATIKSRAVDNAGNVQDPPAEIQVTVDTPPTSTITSPTEGAIVAVGKPVAITGTASDAGGGSVVRVEVSVDGGATFSAATGTNDWSFSWTPSMHGPAAIKSRAVDNTGNVQDPPAEITVTVRVPITIRVPIDQPTIQSAIDVAAIGDTVQVFAGTYPENINFRGKAITVTSNLGPLVTFIDGRNANPVVVFTSGEGRDSVLNGFTLQNGIADQSLTEGGGISILRSSPTITNNTIRNNRACDGGGIGVNFGSPLIQMNTITGNRAGTNSCSGGNVGGGIKIGGASSAEILDNVISDNVSPFGGGIGLFAAGTPIVKRNIIKGNNAFNQGGGIQVVSRSDALIVQNLITGNQADEGGGLYWFVPVGESGRGPILVNNTIADNNATSNGSGIFADGGPGRTELTNNIIVAKPGQSGLYCGLSHQSPPIIRFNNIFSAGGMAYGGTCSDKTGTDGNISADPLFIDPTQGDYHLQQGSPSIDAGDNLTPNLPDKDLDGQPRILDGDDNGTAIVDMGVDEFRKPIRVPSDQPSIQSAINVATKGDRVLVAPGTYFENINFGGKAITVISESGPEVTIIDGGEADPVVIFISGEGRNSVLNGFTLQNGRGFLNNTGDGEGGGITVQRESSPTITNNLIRNNHACRGGGIGIGSGSPLIQRNTITNNGNTGCSSVGGGGISITGVSSAEILDNVISNNVSSHNGGGINMSGDGIPVVKRNIIKGNFVPPPTGQGGGIWIGGFLTPLIVQNIITDNQAPFGGGIYWLSASGSIILNNTIADNNATSHGSGIFADGFDAQTKLINNIIVAKPGQTGLHCGNLNNQDQPIIRFNNIFSSGGMAYGGICANRTGTDGNISADPLFTNPTQGDYHLQQGSSSIDAGDNLTPNLPDTDIDGDPRILDGDGNGTATVDMGVDEFLPPPGFNSRLQDESKSNMLNLNSTNGQYLFARREGIPLIESRLKKAAALIYVSSQIRKRHCGQEHETIPVPVPAHRSAYLPA
jgi:Big-like domain-containing protein/parallel beta helix pectate lyase-like protein